MIRKADLIDLKAWERMPAGWYSRTVLICGDIKFEDHKWSLGREEHGFYLYVVTDLPHPDDPRLNTVYRFNPLRAVCAFCDLLGETEKEDKSNVTPIH